ncbi:MAG TPA: CYTH domain-containing protein [Clostridia bacterium]|nr:CYTH domain-containing protein [Clostridia bacterium]
MGKEIERKYLVKSTEYRQNAIGSKYMQGYLSTNCESVVRVRICEERGYITIKSKAVGLTRSEYEYEIPYKDALELLQTLCIKPIIEKTRYRYPYAGHIWEIDEFYGENEGLTIAEAELKNENEELILPDWIGDEVTLDYRYQNSNLAKNPYKNWSCI